MIRGRCNAVVALFLVTTALAVAGCSDDDDDGGASGAGGSSGGPAGAGGTGAAGDNEATGTGGAGGTAGASDDPTALCIERENERSPDLVDCNECLCESCLEETNDCVDDQGCLDIAACAYEKECILASCYLPETCQEEIDAAGGLGSTSVNLATVVGECSVAAACPCPNVPASGDTVAIGGVLVEATPISEKPRDERPPIEGVEICVYENEDICTTTDENGEFTLEGVPADTDVYLSFTKDGYGSKIMGFSSGSSSLAVTVDLASDALREVRATAAGAVDSEEKGSITAAAITYNTDKVDSPWASSSETGDWIRLEGVSFALEPESGTGPVYADADDVLDPSLDVTAEAGLVYFYDVEPGEYTVTFSHPSMSCMLVQGLDELMVVAGHRTYGLTVFCL
jgi:hypothetical protein